MNKFIKSLIFLTLVSAIMLILEGCLFKKKDPTSTDPGDESTATAAKYNEKYGFELADFKGQPICPGLVYIEGGKTTLGAIKEDFLYAMDNIERTVTVQSFYMDETEVANIHWLEYLNSVKLDSSEESYLAALPDTLVWSSALAFNDAYVDYYFRYAGFRFYPVVGVTWKQVVSFCEWRTTTVQAVLSGDIQPRYRGGGPTFTYGDTIKNKYKNSVKKKESNKNTDSPPYRLPTEDEWEFAALAIIDVWTKDEQTQKRIYPWDGHSIRNPYNKKCGTFLANFKRGRGDYAGIAGKLNDGALITDYVYAYPPNDFGLYNMAGNVNEWVYDKYKPRLQDKFLAGDPTVEDATGTGTGENEEEYYTLLGPNVRVYKGGSWKDIAYWLSPGTRRYLEEDSSTATIGFRCAMDKLGGKGK